MLVVLALCGLVLALEGPRHRYFTASLLSLAVPLVACTALVFLSSLPLWLGAAVLALAVVLPLALVRRWPAVAIVPALFASLAPLLPSVESPAVRTVLLVVLFAACVALAVKRLGSSLRAVCAILGARLALLAVPAASGDAGSRWLFLTALALLALGRGLDVLRSRDEASLSPPPQPLAWPQVQRVLVGVGSVVFLSVCALAFVVPALPSPATSASSARLAKLTAVAPKGGLVWPIPSEALVWDDASPDEFPRIDNLDARWLSGLSSQSLLLLPGTSLGGRFSTHRETTALRMIKDDAELEALRFAAKATVDAVRELAPMIKPGVTEHDLAL